MHVVELPRVKVGVLRSLAGLIIWALLLRRCALSVLQQTFYVFQRWCDSALIVLPQGVLRELQAARGILPLCVGDLGRRVLPLVMAQDAEGMHDGALGSLGGWGLGCAVPNRKEVVEAALRHLCKGISRQEEFQSGC